MLVVDELLLEELSVVVVVLFVVELSVVLFVVVEFEVLEEFDADELEESLSVGSMAMLAVAEFTYKVLLQVSYPSTEMVRVWRP